MPEAPDHDEPERQTDSGIVVRRRYDAGDLDKWDPVEQLGEPGAYPFTRGVQADMYRGRLWTMRQYAGFGTAQATNERFKFLLGAGQTGLSCAFDLPTTPIIPAPRARSAKSAWPSTRSRTCAPSSAASPSTR